MLEIPPNTLEHRTGRPNWHHVAAFLGLTFGLTWLLDLLMYWHGGLGTPGSLSVVQLQMLFPAFSAIVLGIFFSLKVRSIGNGPLGVVAGSIPTSCCSPSSLHLETWERGWVRHKGQ